jgi:hypothetical protein
MSIHHIIIYTPSILPNCEANSANGLFLAGNPFKNDIHDGLLLSATVYACNGCCCLRRPCLLSPRPPHDVWVGVFTRDVGRDDKDLGGYGGGDGLIDSDCVPAGRVATAMAASRRKTIMVVVLRF